MLRDIPVGAHCFVDANIFYYHLVNAPPLSNECSDFLEWIERGEVAGFTSTIAIGEAIHKVMMMEAATTHGLGRAGLLSRLRRHPEMLAALTQHKVVIPTVRALNFHIESIGLGLLEAATDLSVQLRLLTNDALTVAAMKKLGLSHLATNDDDFDRVTGITVWKPR